MGAKARGNLDIINAVSAYLNPRQAARLRAVPGVHVFEDRSLTTEGTGLLGLLSPITSPVLKTASSLTTSKDGTGQLLPTLLYQTNYPMLVGADMLQQAGITGKGVTIAVLDSGLWQDPMQNYGFARARQYRCGERRFGPGHRRSLRTWHACDVHRRRRSHESLRQLSGIAPKANLVEVRAFSSTGAGRYSDVIAGLNWIVANRKKYNIRVLNLSFGATPQSYYWNDPVDQAVMAAWQAGIVVVAAAGNEGPTPMTIDVPGNVPYVITTGALTDNYTPYDASDDRLASFSSTGPTYEGFVKPEVVAPGGHIVASMSSSSYLANIDPGSMILTEQMFTMSGTSHGGGCDHRGGGVDAAVRSGADSRSSEVPPAGIVGPGGHLDGERSPTACFNRAQASSMRSQRSTAPRPTAPISGSISAQIWRGPNTSAGRPTRMPTATTTS